MWAPEEWAQTQGEWKSVRSGQHHWDADHQVGLTTRWGLQTTAVGPTLCQVWKDHCGTPPVLRSSHGLSVYATIPITVEDHLPTLSAAQPDT